MATEGRAWWRKGNSCTQLSEPPLPAPPPHLSLHPWSSVIFSNSKVLLNPSQDRADLSCLRKQAQGTVYSLTSNQSPEALLKVMVWTHPPAGETGWRCCFLAGCAVPGDWLGTELGEAVAVTIFCWACRGAGGSTARRRLQLCACVTSLCCCSGSHTISAFVYGCACGMESLNCVGCTL